MPPSLPIALDANGALRKHYWSASCGHHSITIKCDFHTDHIGRTSPSLLCTSTMANTESLAAVRGQCSQQKPAPEPEPVNYSSSPSHLDQTSCFAGNLVPMDGINELDEYRPGDSTPPMSLLPLDGIPTPAVNVKKWQASSDASGTESELLRVRKKPGPKPKPKLELSDEEEVLPHKKPGPKPKPKTKPRRGKKKRMMTPNQRLLNLSRSQSTSDSNQRVPISSITAFDDAVELIHETIGCVSVLQKPILTYKFSTAMTEAPVINLHAVKDWSGLVMDTLKKIKAKKDVTISISFMPENYMLSLRAKNKPAIKKLGKKGKLTVMDLDNDDSKGNDEGDDGVADGEKKAMAKLDAEYWNGNHVHLTFRQCHAWAVSLACGTKKVTKATPPEVELFSMFHRKAVASNMSPPPAASQFPSHPAYPWYGSMALMPPLGFGMPGFPGYPQMPMGPTLPTYPQTNSKN
ncbi:hypothetical protein B0H14DRAFT_2598994 [Mycena olivaceomarginata]|nr:hypothetical protein B0H14DRAFT_2598994 [Mycena olivaceomarginata]